MVFTLDDDTSVLQTVKKWADEFKRGRKSLEDDSRYRYPEIATTEEKR